MDQCSSVPFPLSALGLDVEDKSGLLHYIMYAAMITLSAAVMVVPYYSGRQPWWWSPTTVVGSRDGGHLLQW